MELPYCALLLLPLPLLESSQAPNRARKPLKFFFFPRLLQLARINNNMITRILLVELYAGIGRSTRNKIFI